MSMLQPLDRETVGDLVGIIAENYRTRPVFIVHDDNRAVLGVFATRELAEECADTAHASRTYVSEERVTWPTS